MAGGSASRKGSGEREERVAHLSGRGEGGEQPVLAAGQGAGAQAGQQAGVEQRGLAGAGIADDGEEAAGRVAQTRQQLVGLAAAAEEDGGLGLRQMRADRDRASPARAALEEPSPRRSAGVTPDSLGAIRP